MTQGYTLRTHVLVDTSATANAPREVILVKYGKDGHQVWLGFHHNTHDRHAHRRFVSATKVYDESTCAIVSD